MAVCLMAVSGVSAQDQQNMQPKERPTAEQMAQRRTDRMAEKLNLTDAQKKEVYGMNLDQARKMEKEREQAKARAEQMKKDIAARDAKMKSILTEEQYTQWRDMQKAMMRANNHGKGHGPQMKCEGRKECCGDCMKDGKSCKGDSQKQCDGQKTCGTCDGHSQTKGEPAGQKSK